jgi:hypothetical protein
LAFEDPPQPRTNSDQAHSLRSQAAACRRLATASRTRTGRTSLEALADHFDEQARKLDPSSQRW